MKCPKCGEELECIWMSESGIITYDVMLCETDKNRLVYEQDYSSGDGGMVYGCPYCSIELCYTEKDAMAILKGELTQELAEKFAEIALSGE